MQTQLRASTPRTIPIRIVPWAPDGAERPTPGSGCSTCPHRSLCLPASYTEQEVQALDALMFARRRVRTGEALFRQGESFHFLYAVRSGTFKSVANLADGREHVTGFHLAGDVVGLDGLSEGRHTDEVVALEDSEICAVPYRQLRELAGGSSNIHAALARLIGQRIVRDQRAMVILGSLSAHERVAAFLLDISARMQLRGYSPKEFHLRMDRADIGSYLGLTLETVSRMLSDFQRLQLLRVSKKHVQLLDLDGLTAMLEGPVRYH